MSERKGFFSWLFGGDSADDDTRVFSAREIGAGDEESREIEQHPQGFTIERAAEIINNLPSDVSRESAVRIVRGTLTAAGIKVEDLERASLRRETKLESEIGLARGRRDELNDTTEEVVRSLEEDISKAREARDNGLAEEEERISRAKSGLQDIRRVRSFFSFPGVDRDGNSEEDEEITGHGEKAEAISDETQVMEPFDADETRVIKRPGPLANSGDEEAGER